jgi:hypothetical protein
LGAKGVPLFQPLIDVAETDMMAGFLDWHACVIHDAFDSEFQDLFNALYNGYILGDITAQQYQDQIDEGARAAIRRIERVVSWDKSRW